MGANDVLSGDAGNDIYLFAAGDGNTTINNYDTSAGHNDVLRFASGINPTGVLATRLGDDLKLTLQSTGEIITVQNHFSSNGLYTLNAVEFTDGTVWSSTALASMILIGTSGADNITGFASDDTIDGLGGNDTISGAGGNDYLSGNTGNDSLNGGVGNDTLGSGLFIEATI